MLTRDLFAVANLLVDAMMSGRFVFAVMLAFGAK